MPSLPDGFLLFGGYPMRSLTILAMSIVAGFILFGITLIFVAVT